MRFSVIRHKAFSTVSILTAIVVVGFILLGSIIVEDWNWHRSFDDKFQLPGQQTTIWLVVVLWFGVSALTICLLMISRRRQSRIETRLRESQQMLQMVLDNIPARVFWKDRDCEYLGCNRRFAMDTDLDDPSRIIGKTDYDCTWREQAALYQKDDRQVMESGRPKLNYEEPQTSPEGKPLWLRTFKIPLKDLNGNIIGVLGTYEDITEKKLAEKELRDSRAQLQAVMESLPFDLFVLDTDGRYILENTTCRRHWGDLIGKRSSDLPVAPEVAVRWEDNNRRAFAGETVEGEVRYSDNNLDGYFHNIIAPVRDGDKILGILGVNIDITERKIAEKALNESLQSSADIVASIPSGLLIFRYRAPDELILLDANPEAEYLVGIQIDEWCGREFDEIMPEAQKLGLTRTLLEVMKTGKTYMTENFAYKDERIDGSFRIRAFRMPGERLGVALENITERTRAYEALRESEERYRFLYRNMPIMLYSMDAEGNLVDVSHQWLESMEYERSEVLGRKITDFLTSEARRQVKKSVMPQLQQTGACRDMQLQFIKKGGDLIDALMSVISRTGTDNRPTRHHAVMMDISDLKKAEVSIRKFFRAVEQSPGAIAITDRYGLVEYINPRFTEITGNSTEDILGKNLRFFAHDISNNDAYQQIRKSLQEGKCWSGNLQRRHKDGQTYWERLTVSPILDDDGKTINYLSVGEDISHEVMMYRTLAESEKMSAIGLLAAGVAHEFKNYLCGIIGNASHAIDNMDKSTGRARALETLSTIIGIAEQADNLVTSLLSYSKATIEPYHRGDLCEIISRTVQLIEQEMNVLSINLITHFEEIPPIRLSAGKIQQLLLGLIINAQQAIGSEGIIMIGLTGEAESIKVSIGDNGGGIPAENMARIYDPFFSTKGVWGKDHDVGTGMGLTLCRNIAREHGGDLKVDSIPGAGTTFTLLLPLEAVTEEALTPAWPDSTGLKIILVSSRISTIKNYYTMAQNMRLQLYPVLPSARIIFSENTAADLIIYDAGDMTGQDWKIFELPDQGGGIPRVIINHRESKSSAISQAWTSAAVFDDLPDLAELIRGLRKSTISS